MIITTYHKNGVKERKAVGYAGDLCHEATKPYEAREIGGQVTKTPTPEADLPANQVETDTRIRQQ